MWGNACKQSVQFFLLNPRDSDEPKEQKNKLKLEMIILTQMLTTEYIE